MLKQGLQRIDRSEGVNECRQLDSSFLSSAKSSYARCEFINDLRNAILAEFEKDTGLMDIPKTVRLPQYAHWVGYEEWLEMNALRLTTDLWMGPFPWIPDARQAAHYGGQYAS